MTIDNNLSKSKSEEYIKLADLLQKKRSREKAEKVELILQSNLDPAEKILKIDQIDNETLVVEVNDSGKKRENVKNFLKEENLFTAAAARELRKRIRNNHPKRSYFSYLFRDYGRIKEVFADSGFFVNSIIPPVIRVQNDRLELFWMRTGKDANELLDLTQRILDTGWQYLNKFEYNLMFQFHKLCQKIKELDYSTIRNFSENNLERFKSLENYFITCRYHSLYIETIINSVFYMISNYPEWRFDAVIMANKVKRLLYGDRKTGTLESVIQGFNIMKTRRFLTFDDLYVKGYETLISNDDFECNKKIRSLIDSFIDKNLESLLDTRKIKEEKERIGKYISYDKDSGYDFSTLSLFYDKACGIENGNFKQDSSLIIQFVMNFCDGFIKTYEPLLNGKITIDTASKVEVFSPGSFQLEISKIRSGFQHLAKYRFSLPKFSRDGYIEASNLHKSDSSPKSEAVQIIKEIVSRMNEISDKLIGVLSANRYNHSQDEDKRNVPLDPSSVKGKSVSIPYGSERITSTSFINGKSILIALSEIVNILMMFKIFLGDEKLTLLLESEKRVDSEIEKKRELLERLATVKKYREIAEKYNI